MMMRRTAVDIEQTENLIESDSIKSNKCLFITCSIVSHLSFTVLGYLLRYIEEESVCGDGSNL